MNFFKGKLKGTIVVIAATILATVGINAADNIGNLSNSLLGAAIGGLAGPGGPCPSEMTFVSSSGGGFCMDTHEAAPSEECLFTNPGNETQTLKNLDESPGCVAVSKEGVLPWRFISQNQATLMCAKSGKHLPSNEEWFSAALGTPDKQNNLNREDCNTDQNWGTSDPGKTGSGEKCVSSFGAHDMIGNVWEWTKDTANAGSFNNRTLPEPGFVKGADEFGVPTETALTEDNNYYRDRFWIDKTRTTGMFRGGFWNSKSDGGLYALHAEVPPSFSGTGVGFRCASEAR